VFLEACGPAACLQPDNEGFTPLHLAVDERDGDRLLRVLLDGGPPGAATAGISGPICSVLQLAAGKNNVPAVQLLLARGARPEERATVPAGRPCRGWTPMHFAAMGGGVDAIRALIETGASVEARDAMERTPLFAAAGSGQVGAARALVEAGARVDVVDSEGCAPCRHARESGEREVADYLFAQRKRACAACGKTRGRGGGRVGLFACRGCGRGTGVRYCGLECARVHWCKMHHRRECEAVTKQRGGGAKG